MRFSFARAAWVADFDASAWTGLAPTSSRVAIAEGGYRHDHYSARVQSSLQGAIERLLRYEIFAPERMRAKVCTEDGLVAVGATIVQRIRFAPVTLETAVRVIECERTPSAAQFAYVTLSGHPERGIARFAVEPDGDAFRFIAEAWSRPGHVLAQLGRPLARYLQRAITREAVEAFCSAR